MREAALAEMAKLAAADKGAASAIVNADKRLLRNPDGLKAALQEAGFEIVFEAGKFTKICRVKTKSSDEGDEAKVVGFGQAGDEDEALLCAVRGMIVEGQ